jgi:hypothetical protein
VPSLTLVEQDPRRQSRPGKRSCRLGRGFAVEPAERGVSRGNSRSRAAYGGVEGVLRRALAAVGPGWDAVRAPSESSPRSPPRRRPRGPDTRRPERGHAHLSRSAPARRPYSSSGSATLGRSACGRSGTWRPCRVWFEAPGTGGPAGVALAGGLGTRQATPAAARIAEYLGSRPVDNELTLRRALHALVEQASTVRAGDAGSQGHAVGEARRRRLLAHDTS